MLKIMQSKPDKHKALPLGELRYVVKCANKYCILCKLLKGTNACYATSTCIRELYYTLLPESATFVQTRPLDGFK